MYESTFCLFGQTSSGLSGDMTLKFLMRLIVKLFTHYRWLLRPYNCYGVCCVVLRRKVLGVAKNIAVLLPNTEASILMGIVPNRIELRMITKKKLRAVQGITLSVLNFEMARQISLMKRHRAVNPDPYASRCSYEKHAVSYKNVPGKHLRGMY